MCCLREGTSWILLSNMSGPTWCRLNAVRVRFGYILREQRFKELEAGFSHPHGSPVLAWCSSAMDPGLSVLLFPLLHMWGWGPVAWAPPGGSLEMESLRPYPRPLDPGSTLSCKTPREFLCVVNSRKSWAGTWCPSLSPHQNHLGPNPQRHEISGSGKLLCLDSAVAWSVWEPLL